MNPARELLSVTLSTDRPLDGLRFSRDATHTFPTELAPKSMVKDGSPSRHRSTALISAFRGKKPGSREKVCLARICARSRVSFISRLASSSNFLDSVSERTVSAGCDGRQR